MRYFVVADDGAKYGPADIETLNGWIREGRMLPGTLVEEEASGARMAASAVAGLVFPAPVPPTPIVPPQPGPSAGPYTPPSPEARPFAQPNPQPYPYASNYARPPGPYPNPVSDSGNTEVVWSWVLGVAGLLCCFIFPIFGTFAGYSAKSKGNPGGQAAMVFNIVVLLISIAGGIVAALSFLSRHAW